MCISKKEAVAVEPFDKKRCLDNIYFLAKQKGKKSENLKSWRTSVAGTSPVPTRKTTLQS